MYSHKLLPNVIHLFSYYLPMNAAPSILPSLLVNIGLCFLQFRKSEILLLVLDVYRND